MPDPKLSLIVARARNGIIGVEGDLPWRLRDDLRHFKSVTQGAPVIMGRKTWQSLPRRPLPGRANLVVSRDWAYVAPGARIYSSLNAALAVARALAVSQKLEEYFVIGGATLYEAALPMAERIYLTEVDAAPKGDVHFPDLSEADWAESSRVSHDAGEQNDHAFDVVVLERRESMESAA
ncbi:MAG: dihydrofolate reductase [Hyphomonadaceae bacterium]|nr:dihydrofolate reductase [Hyphomonadaceae bacterium]